MMCDPAAIMTLNVGGFSVKTIVYMLFNFLSSVTVQCPCTARRRYSAAC
jgi:hypothetical protein